MVWRLEAGRGDELTLRQVDAVVRALSARLDLYLSDPQAVYAGTWMGSPPIRDAKQRADILCVLGGQ